MRYKIFTIILICVLVVAGIVTIITGLMIAYGTTDDIEYAKLHSILVISGSLTFIALLGIAVRAIILLRDYEK